MSNGNDLGDFLRVRREQLHPADVGLPDNGRRRTPGLRREEVAALAGVSIDYLVRLEQGRDRNPSPAVIMALADALQLESEARLHLKILSSCESAAQLCDPETDASLGDEEVSDTTRSLLDRLGATAAVVVGPWQQVIAHNATWERIMGPVGVLDSEPANLIAFTFLDDRARTVYPEWATVADEQVAALRSTGLRWRSDERMAELLDRLLTSPEFEARWERHTVARRMQGRKVVHHPQAGELRVQYEVMQLADDTDRRMIVWLPADDATDAAIAELRRGGEGQTHLRVVGD